MIRRVKVEAESSKSGGSVLGNIKETNQKGEKINMQESELHKGKEHSKEKTKSERGVCQDLQQSK